MPLTFLWLCLIILMFIFLLTFQKCEINFLLDLYTVKCLLHFLWLKI